MIGIKHQLKCLQRDERIREILERWPLEDVREFLESRPSEFDHLKINCILKTFLEETVTARTKEIMKVLLEQGADPMFPYDHKACLAGEAFKKSDVEVVTMFLDHLKDINASLDIYERRAIHFIIEYQDESLLPIALSYNPDLDTKDKSGLTALHTAVLNCNYPKTKILLDAGANVEIIDNCGNAPIHSIFLRRFKQEYEPINLLLLDVANLTLRNGVGDTPLHLIMKFYKPFHLKTLQTLLDRGADPWKPNAHGFIPLNDLIRYNNPFPLDGFQILEKIFERGSSINKRDFFGNTILHMLAWIDRCQDSLFLDILNLVLKYGADPNLANDRNETVIDVFKKTNHSRGLHLIKYLVLRSFGNKFQFGPRLLSSIESHKKFERFFNICKGELINLKSSSFYSSKRFTLLDVLAVTSTKVLLRYSKNKYFIETMSTFDVDMYPVYGRDLKERFQFGFERYEAEMTAIQYLAEGGLLTYLCMECIVTFLPTDELRRIVSCNDISN